MLSEVQSGTRREPGATASDLDAFPAARNWTSGEPVAPLEFRLLAEEGLEQRLVDGSVGTAGVSSQGTEPAGLNEGHARDIADRERERQRTREEGFAEGEREGRRRGRLELEAEMYTAVARERAGILEAVEEFGRAREEYFDDVQQQVVKLALAIAARVLHREAHVDGLLLEGAVRVALEKMAERSGVVLRAAPCDLADWERLFATMAAEERPRVQADVCLARGECVLETKMGTVELGVSAQLQEIEKGFFDLLSHRPERVSQKGNARQAG